jgi:cytochrome bd-type quinol oxidase subunit 1
MEYGVHQDSVNNEYVRIYWFESDGIPTLSSSSLKRSGSVIENCITILHDSYPLVILTFWRYHYNSGCILILYLFGITELFMRQP